MIVNFFHQLLTIVFPIHVLVRLIYRTRRYLYTIGRYESIQFIPRTISIGNIVMGGSGKTPFLKWVIKNLNSDNRILVSSRGHKSDCENDGCIVYPGDLVCAKKIGDENTEVLKLLKSGVIAVGKNRIKQISKCLTENSFSFLLLDDGFQHLKIQRDLNIVLFNVLLDCERLKVFPRGYLREGIGSIYEADVIIFTNCSDHFVSKNEIEIRRVISPYLHPNAKFFRSKVILKNIFSLSENKSDSDWRVRKYILISAIANPEKVGNLLKNQGVVVVESLFFSDHHFFTDKDYKRIKLLSEKYDADILLTEKDSVKFDSEELNEKTFYTVVELGFFGKEDEVVQILKGESV